MAKKKAVTLSQLKESVLNDIAKEAAKDAKLLAKMKETQDIYDSFIHCMSARSCKLMEQYDNQEEA